MWSFQYIFLRVAVPAFGTAAASEGRALFASLFLVPWVVWVARQRIGPLEHWKDPFAFRELTDALWKSVEIGVLSTVIATILGARSPSSARRGRSGWLAALRAMSLTPSTGARSACPRRPARSGSR
jgi:ABC-type Fe3+ transport system permease subunit